IAAPDPFRIGVLGDAGLRLADLEGREDRVIPISSELKRHINVTQTRRGLRVVAWVGDTAFDLLDDTGQVLCRVDVPGSKGHEPIDVIVSPDASRLACATHIGGEISQVAVFDATSGKQTAVCIGHDNAIRTLIFSPDSSRLASGSADRTARVWD